MENKKMRISEFINSMEGEELNEATCLMGGTTGKDAKPEASTNGGNCINGNRDGCNYSTNDGACQNVQGGCDNSKNGTNCNNSYQPSVEK